MSERMRLRLELTRMAAREERLRLVMQLLNTRDGDRRAAAVNRSRRFEAQRAGTRAARPGESQRSPGASP
jgi:hypothetical protein